ncbi:hypothetical protein WA158_000377 [Blastocystis sp. Blastoise]
MQSTPMFSTTNYIVDFPSSGELGMSLNISGRYVFVASVSGQSEWFGILKNDRFVAIGNTPCVDKSSEFVSKAINSCRRKNQLWIEFQRSFPIDDMEKLEKSVNSSLENDAIFHEGSVYFSTKGVPERLVHIRIVRMKGPLLRTANQFKLIPFSISVVYFESVTSQVALGGFNLLPCKVVINEPDIKNERYSFSLVSSQVTSKFGFTSKSDLNQWVLLLCDLIKQDVQPLLKQFNDYFKVEKDDAIVSQKEKNDEIYRMMKNNLNIPIFLNLAQIYKEIMDIALNNIPAPALLQRISQLHSNCTNFLSNGYAPLHVFHSISAFLITVYNDLHIKEEWNEDIQRHIKEMATYFHQQQDTYIRNNLVRSDSFFVFRCIDTKLCGIYKMTIEKLKNLVVYKNEYGSLLFQEHDKNGRKRWVLVKEGEKKPQFYIYTDQSIPPRFQWIAANQVDITPVVQAIIPQT